MLPINLKNRAARIIILLCLGLIFTTVAKDTAYATWSSSNPDNTLTGQDIQSIRSIISEYYATRYDERQTSTQRPISDLFSQDDKGHASFATELRNRAIARTMFATYNMGYLDYEYSLEFTEVEVNQHTGQVIVHVEEDAAVTFERSPTSESKYADDETIFYLRSAGKNNWRIQHVDYIGQMHGLRRYLNQNQGSDTALYAELHNFYMDVFSSPRDRSVAFSPGKLPDKSTKLQLLYGPSSAVYYARNWVYGHNPNYPNLEPYDCTNFVSQALYAGGIPMDTWAIGVYYYNVWWATSSGASGPWQNVEYFYSYMINNYRAYLQWNVELLHPGDIIQINWGNSGRYDHSVIVTSMENGMWPRITAHSQSVDDIPLYNVMSPGDSARGLDINW